MAPRSSLIRFGFVCIVLAVLVMNAESLDGHDHGTAKAPAPHVHNHDHAPQGPHAPAPAPHEHDHAHAPAPHGPHSPAPAAGAATFSAAFPQLIATALFGVLSFVF